MRHTAILILLLTLGTLQMSGVRAYPHPKTIVQTDGSTLTILGHGDEFRHYVTTTDGYTIVKGHDGVYRYAILSEGRLKPSSVKASDADKRTAAETDFLYSVQRDIKPAVTPTGKRLMRLSTKTDTPLLRKNNGSFDGKRHVETEENTRIYRGLVILVNFTDRKFSRGDRSLQLVDDMMNKEQYTYYYDPLLDATVECTGSVRDYFLDNSDGEFITEFDVVGPVDIDVNQYFINGTERTYELCRNVLETADKTIDYRRYDSDGDGMVDMLYLLYAGYSSNYQGNDERLVWPHAGHFGDYDNDLVLDGMRFGRFACSSEIYGWHADEDKYLDGIGVIVHEFSHVLGFKDHYDVSGYLNEDPGSWDVMASGNYNGVFNDTPCGYNSYEKYAAGFISPRTLTREDDKTSVSLRPLSSYGDAARIVSTQDSTVFMLENRQLEKWDRYLPGHGMLVWRVDSCDNEYWEHNALNVNGRLHFKLVRAMGATMTLFKEIEDTDYDPFPGTRNVRDLTNYSIESNLLTDKRYPSPLTLRGIVEENDIISFEIEEDPDALDKPYIFHLLDLYGASGLAEDDAVCKWNVSARTVESDGRSRHMIYNLVPDTKNICASDPKYADGLGAPYLISGDRKKIIIEPYRVALLEDQAVWLVDFNDLDNGGSGAIVLNMSPFGDISLSSSDSVLGYCFLPKKNYVVVREDIIERFSLMRDIKFDSTAGIDTVESNYRLSEDNDTIYNLQGMRVNNPRKGEFYIIGGKKVIY